MTLDYELKKLEGVDRMIQKEIDDAYISYCQEQYEKHELLGNKREANFFYWILLLIDRLEEAGYEWQEAQEKIEDLEGYIEDWQVRPNLGKHFDARY